MDDIRAGWLLREVARLHGQMQRNEVAACCDTSSTQCHILTELDRTGSISMAELVRRLGVDKGWTSRAVEAMAQEGLLVKEPGTTDRRTVLISLTQSGERKAADVNQTLNAQSGRVMRRIPPEERQAVYQALEVLHKALHGEYTGEPVLIKLGDDIK